MQAPLSVPSVEVFPQQKKWTERYDFDSDGRVDTLYYTYTGGAHCCYRLQVRLSASRKRIDLPYDIEGGYMVFGLSQPEQFTIEDYDKDGVPEIIVKDGEGFGSPEGRGPTHTKWVIDFFPKGRTERGNYYKALRWKP